MRLAVCGNNEIRSCMVKYIAENPVYEYRTIEFEEVSSAEQLIKIVNKSNCDAVFIAVSGAEGMEGAIGVRMANKNIPIVWFSDDKLFAVQAQRLNTAYFGVMPLSFGDVTKAIRAIS